uniref:bifunctional 4-hydroxy-2-oxoglutarate aldolase/2-dehydro-3-deoxy-phosphogluconate aldolase n=1 Tax=Promineifilum sp. TaxID=2664178 RepID=UPI0035B31FC6
MNKQETLNRLHALGLVAVIRGPSPELTVRMVEALVAGGVTGIEITYTTPNAPDVVRALDRAMGDSILLGMGTLTDPAQAVEAQEAGARYLVSPITDEALGRAMVATGLPVMMGALTPTEVYQAHCLGSDVVKLFPGSAVGPDYVKALHGPFPYIRI